ncbi:MAG TPA: hypothetical protein VIL74_00630 [Pyrinomonadaceae bacterium]|jgi:hypothetical protein
MKAIFLFYLSHAPAGTRLIFVLLTLALGAVFAYPQTLEPLEAAPSEPKYAALETDGVQIEKSLPAGASRGGKYFYYAEKNMPHDGGRSPFFEKKSIVETEPKRSYLPEKPFKEAVPKRDADPAEELAEDKDELPKSEERFHWKPALAQSGIFLGIQHAFRLSQKKTKRELPGPFFRDWGNSVKSLHGWRDGDSGFINYVAHPLQGGVTSRIFINNSDRAKRQEFGKSKDYWVSRLKSAAWSTVWGVQFELGPISEATIGNVGLRRKKGYSPMAYVDLVITPTVGTGVAIGEDAIDKYILKNWLERKDGRATWKIKFLRSVLTPTTSFTNLLRGKPPWKRDNRFN